MIQPLISEKRIAIIAQEFAQRMEGILIGSLLLPIQEAIRLAVREAGEEAAKTCDHFGDTDSAAEIRERLP